MEKMEVLLETSARHIHVTQEALETLFGKGHELTKKKDLSQPGQFACEERVTTKANRPVSLIMKCNINQLSKPKYYPNLTFYYIEYQ